MIPLTMHFDYVPNQRIDGAIHLPKIYQAAPYSQAIRVKNVADGVYRDFSGFTEIRMQARLAQSKPVLFMLSQSAGTLRGYPDRLQLAFPAAITATLALEAPNALVINEVPFVYDITFYQGDEVMERFAQGTGLIVINTTRSA